MNRRFFTFGAAALLAAPSIIRVSALMPMRATHRPVELAHYRLQAKGEWDGVPWSSSMSGDFRGLSDAEANFRGGLMMPGRTYYGVQVSIPHRTVWVPA